MAIGTGTAIALVAIPAVALVTKAVIERKTAKDAADDQREALDEAAVIQAEGVESATQFQQPFLETGTEAFNQLSDIVQAQAALPLPEAGEVPEFSFDISQLQADPGIQFGQEQARKTIEASAASRGGVLGGGTLQELQERSIGLSGLQTNQAFDRQLLEFQQNILGRQLSNTEKQQILENRQTDISNLAGIAQVGPQTASNLSNIAIGHAGSTGDLAIQAGNVNAAERVARSQALTEGIGGVSNSIQDLILLQSLLSNKSPANAGGVPLLPTGAGDLSGLNTGVA